MILKKELVIIVQIAAGTQFFKALEEAKQLATEENISVIFFFNDTLVTVSSDSELTAIVKEFYDKVEKNRQSREAY